MVSKIPSIILLLASMVVISSGDTLSLPEQFSLPPNAEKICFAGRFNLTLNVGYTKNDNSNASAIIPLNETTYTSYNGSCSISPNVHQLIISMLNGSTVIIFDFSVNDQNMTSLTKVHGHITVDDKQSFIIDYKNTTAGVTSFSGKNETLFEAVRDHSYRCNSKTQIINFETYTGLAVTSIDIENLKIQPFVDDSQKFPGFATETVCQADDEGKDSNLIPIIVGACLALLVVIVLVAYLIGRRRSRIGYQSV